MLSFYLTNSREITAEHQIKPLPQGETPWQAFYKLTGRQSNEDVHANPTEHLRTLEKIGYFYLRMTLATKLLLLFSEIDTV
jgi:hypothetical protein